MVPEEQLHTVEMERIVANEVLGGSSGRRKMNIETWLWKEEVQY